jgi:pyridoxamine 5'-phosphate oxidase family protein
MFSDKELDYMNEQRLCRTSTVNADGQPDVVPLGIEAQKDVLYIGGVTLKETRKYKNVAAGRTRVSVVIDDMISWDPPFPRGIRIYGTGEIVEREGMYGPGTYIRIAPKVSWSWNIEEQGAPGPGAKFRKTRH